MAVGVVETASHLKKISTPTPRWYKQRKVSRKQLKRRLHAAAEFHDETIVMSSSVTDNDGCRGLYALRQFEKGSQLSHVYPGHRLSQPDSSELNEYLVSLTHGSKLDAASREALPEVLVTLKQRWNITFYNSSLFYPPNWDRLYDNYIAYRFENETAEEDIHWNVYNWDGTIHAQETTQSNASLFINEPPAYCKFVNRFTRKEQVSRHNVVAETDKDGNIVFRVTQRIEYGEEILLHYGPFYRRNYLINYADFPEDCSSDDESSACYRERVTAYQALGNLFTCQDLRVDTFVRAVSDAMKERPRQKKKHKA